MSFSNTVGGGGGGAVTLTSLLQADAAAARMKRIKYLGRTVLGVVCQDWSFLESRPKSWNRYHAPSIGLIAPSASELSEARCSPLSYAHPGTSFSARYTDSP